MSCQTNQTNNDLEHHETVRFYCFGLYSSAFNLKNEGKVHCVIYVEFSCFCQIKSNIIGQLAHIFRFFSIVCVSVESLSWWKVRSWFYMWHLELRTFDVSSDKNQWSVISSHSDPIKLEWKYWPGVCKQTAKWSKQESLTLWIDIVVIRNNSLIYIINCDFHFNHTGKNRPFNLIGYK